MSIERRYTIKHDIRLQEPPREISIDISPKAQELPKVSMVGSNAGKEATKKGYEALKDLAFRGKSQEEVTKGFFGVLAHVFTKLNP